MLMNAKASLKLTPEIRWYTYVLIQQTGVWKLDMWVIFFSFNNKTALYQLKNGPEISFLDLNIKQ